MTTIQPLHRYMKERGLNQAEIAEVLDVTAGAISKVFNQNRKVYLTVDQSGNIASADELVKFGRGKRQPASVEQVK